jgi:hypothetical protein
MSKYTTSVQGVVTEHPTTVTGRAALSKAFSAILAGFLFRLLLAWEIMLLIGGVHAELDNRIPAYGYWGVFLALWTLAALKTIFTYKASIGIDKS